MYNGNIQILDKENKKISEIHFESYDLNLSPYSHKESSHFYTDELKTSIIINKIKKNNYSGAEFAELNNRIINPIYIFCISLLPLLIFKMSRRPDESWLIPIIIISICGFAIKLLEIGMAHFLIKNNSFFILNYLIPFGVITIILLLLYRENKKLIRKNNVF